VARSRLIANLCFKKSTRSAFLCLSCLSHLFPLLSSCKSNYNKLTNTVSRFIAYIWSHGWAIYACVYSLTVFCNKNDGLVCKSRRWLHAATSLGLRCVQSLWVNTTDASPTLTLASRSLSVQMTSERKFLKAAGDEKNVFFISTPQKT